MKQLLVIIFILISSEVKSQSYSDIIGLTYPFGSKVKALDTLINYGTGGNPGTGLVISAYIDSSYSTRYIVLQRENFKMTSSGGSYTILDLIEFENIGDSSTVVIGTYHAEVLDNDTLNYGFIIAYECCHDLSNADWQDTPQIPIKSWYTAHDKIIEIDPKRVLREYAYVIFNEK